MKPENFNNESTFIDLGNEVRRIKNITILADNERKEREEQIAEEIYRIFTHKLK